MEKLLKMAVGLEGNSGAIVDHATVHPGLSLGCAAMKRVGPRLAAEAGIEGGYFPAAATSAPGRGPVGAFVGGGVFVPFSTTALLVTLRASSGYDFSRDDPYVGAGVNAKIVWESPRSDGSASLFPFVGLNAGYIWDSAHGGQALLTAGFYFDLGRS